MRFSGNLDLLEEHSCNIIQTGSTMPPDRIHAAGSSTDLLSLITHSAYLCRKILEKYILGWAFDSLCR
jgi:hypothetical protein